ncbi:MAG TPA: heme exporter protein CcmD [Xanthomonadales bacterium]|nr:heme exporter protein CcmD [Xanthomonadales bacterium]
MSHTPFIWAAYTVGAVVLLWCAVAPLLRKKSACRDIRRLIQLEERSGDPNP